ncbi:hypothetical protein [uncultured Methylobacterium sp.]|jgi:hypothetical protein|uniref:hypothetical protein n=1 Tax=uncultured Methylobacterium sp. TaxID=157278 RepID=UPI00260F4757|nr:hypothetical protein [uncultured Methylobacterium sp.]
MSSSKTAHALLHLSHQISAIALKMLDGEPALFDTDKLDTLLSTLAQSSHSNSEDQDLQQENEEVPAAEGEIDPEWFKPNAGNNHLTEKGVKFLFGLWKDKVKPWAAAKRMGIAFRAVQLRYAKFEAGDVP